MPSIYGGSPGWRSWSRPGWRRSRRTSALSTGGLLTGLDELGAAVATPRAEQHRGALICVRSTDVDELVAALATERIVTSSRDGNLRISLHLYNVEEDVDRVLEALAKHRRLLA